MSFLKATAESLVDLQVTALGNPKLLERVSGALVALQNLFSQFDMDMNNKITRDEFSQVGLSSPASLLSTIYIHL